VATKDRKLTVFFKQKSEINYQCGVQVLSLQGSEMFITTSLQINFAPLGAKPLLRYRAVALLRSAEKETAPGYKHLAPLGRSKQLVPLRGSGK
jgi:hypothetical protein